MHEIISNGKILSKYLKGDEFYQYAMEICPFEDSLRAYEVVLVN
jgi:hypothetical protein